MIGFKSFYCYPCFEFGSLLTHAAELQDDSYRQAVTQGDDDPKTPLARTQAPTHPRKLLHPLKHLEMLSCRQHYNII